MVTRDGVTFEPIERGDLEGIAVVAQAVDDQWVPRELLNRLVNEGLALGDVREEYEKAARAEYMRALINAEHVFINRAYIYNTRAVFQDFLEERLNSAQVFRELLDGGAIIPSLFKESSPAEPPGTFTVWEDAYRAWVEVCKSTCMKCFRLSWQDELNKELTDNLYASRFNDFVQTFHNRDPLGFIKEFNLPEDAAPHLRKFLRSVSRFALDYQDKNDDRLPGREQFYERFVVQDGTRPVEGKYDGNKPFGAEFKQLLDLAYNVTGADAHLVYAMSPVDSLSRSALQELDYSQLGALPTEDFDADKLLQAVANVKFQLLQQPLSLPSLDLLTLEDIQALRRTPAWGDYTRSVEAFMSLDNLLTDPEVFGDLDKGAPAVYRRYEMLGRQIQNRTTKRKVEKWQPKIELLVEGVGQMVSLKWGLDYLGFNAKVDIDAIIQRAAPIAVYLGIHGADKAKQIGRSLANYVEIYRGRLSDPRNQWKTLNERIRELPGIVEAVEEHTQSDLPETEGALAHA